MKKVQVFGFVFLLGVLFFSTLAAASIAGDINKGIETLTQGLLKPLFEGLLGKSPSNEYLFARVLILLIVFPILWAVLSRIPFFQDRTWVLVVISVAISLLAVRGIVSKEWIDTIVLPSQTLGIALSAGIPFIVYAIIVHSEQGLGNLPRGIRTFAWVFFIVIFTGLWLARYDELSRLAQSADPWPLYIYPLTALLAFFMTVFDGTFQRWRNRAASGKIRSESHQRQLDTLRARLAEADERFANNTITDARHRQLTERYEKQIRKIERMH